LSRKSGMPKNQEIVLQIRHNFTPGCCGFASTETAASWGDKIGFGFVANSGNGNEVSIAEKIFVGYKGKFRFPKSHFPVELHILSDISNFAATYSCDRYKAKLPTSIPWKMGSFRNMYLHRAIQIEFFILK